MKTSNFTVQIPNPCNEDWNKMQPVDKGRFCGSCQKTVIDFTGKTDAEIKDLLLAQSDQKICGHFKKTQIGRPLQIQVDINELRRTLIPKKTFAVALLFVFGTSLFSCYDYQNNKFSGLEISGNVTADFFTKPMMGEPSINNENTINVAPPDSSRKDKRVTCGITKEEVMMGKPSFNSEEWQNSIKGDVLTVIDTPEVKTLENEFGIMGLIQAPDTTELIITGGPIAIFNEPEIEPDQIVDSVRITSAEENTLQGKETGLEIYPNPGKGEFVVQYRLATRTDVTMQVFDGNGKLIMGVVDIIGQHSGTYKIPVDLTGYPAGVYVVTLLCDEKKVSKKLIITK